MSARLDLPPIARRLEARLRDGMHMSDIDDDTAAVFRELRALVVNAVTELENDLIISNARAR